MGLLELREEDLARHSVEGVGCPVEHLDEIEGAEPVGLRELAEQRAQHGYLKVPAGKAPVEPAGDVMTVARPKHPGGEDAVEESLDEGGMEEMVALASLEADAERRLQRLTDLLQRRQTALVLDPPEGVACVRGEKPGDVLRLAQ